LSWLRVDLAFKDKEVNKPEDKSEYDVGREILYLEASFLLFTQLLSRHLGAGHFSRHLSKQTPAIGFDCGSRSGHRDSS
jgi:hypothetical protein